LKTPTAAQPAAGVSGAPFTFVMPQAIGLVELPGVNVMSAAIASPALKLGDPVEPPVNVIV
jgi:hypothetical protein